ncbi:MAG TPA: LysR family substrate-binding domain-containing protein [Pseudonocardiaceae bacterium]|jgi:DNA-binding transcriptional LysR family regulator|nr:LysR family substrate-binding domain-containing protein [Pseudonocardiaceae bacterium]
MTGATFRLGYVLGVTPSKWLRTWAERMPDVPLTLVDASNDEAVGLVRTEAVDAALLRLPIDRTDLHAIPLYTETTVVVVPKEHWLAAADEVTGADLADEVVLHPEDDVLDWARPPGVPAARRPVTTAYAMGMVAAEAGVLVVPQSLARLYHRKDLTYRPVTDAVQSSVALVWPSVTDTSDLVEQFIGIVRGRTVNSTRGRPPAPPKAATKVPARERPTRRSTPRRHRGRR